MFKYRFECADKARACFKMERIIEKDFPCGKTFFGGNLYKAGIHFQEYDKIIRGFYINIPEIEVKSGSPIRVSFKGEFVQENERLFFDVYIYPRIADVLLLIFTFLFFTIYGKITGFLTSAAVIFIFAKGYCKMIRETRDEFSRIFN